MRLILERLEGLSDRRFRWLVFFSALALRLACLIWWEAGDYTEVLGYDRYVTVAQRWLGWLPPAVDVTHPPVYTLWIAAVFGVIRSPSFLVIQAANVLFSCAICLLVGLWAERAVSKTVGRLAALWCVFDPLLVYFAPQLQSEPFFVFLEMLFFLAVLRIGTRPATATSVLMVGLFGGVLTMTRSAFALYPFFLCAAILLAERGRGRAWLWLVVFVGWGVPISLWTTRNYVRYGEFVPLTINSGWSRWEGFTLDRDTVRRRPEEMMAELKRVGIDTTGPDRSVRAADDHFKAKWSGYLREHPWESAKIIAGKALLYWRPMPYDPHQLSIRLVLAGYFTCLFILALFGAWTLRSRAAVFAPVFGLIVYLSLLHSVFFTSLRYRSPLEPFLCVLAAAGFHALLTRRGAGDASPSD
ncbi:hypothetical protein ACFL2T_04375 [Elusimicrobiota bacterium]